jgi:lipid A ethanolaminephosphotransferase
MMANVFETNVSEARDLLSWTFIGNLGPRRRRAGALARAARGEARRRDEGRAARRGPPRASLVVAVAATTALYSVLAPMVRNHMGLRYLPNPLVPIWSTVRVATKPIWNRPKPIVPITAGAALGPSHAVASAKPPLLVLVVGETARADHFALNGYPRDTTPELAARGVLSFRNVWSCGTNTLASVPCMFSSLGKAQFESRKAEHENLLDVVQAAGMAVLWLDNQAGCKSVCARVRAPSTSDLAGTPAGERLCADGECLDEALLEGLDARIAALPEAKRAKGVLLVMHQMGSHGPGVRPALDRGVQALPARMPDDDARRLRARRAVNVYDNSIAYTDHVLARTIDWAKAQPATRRRCSTSATTASRSASTACSCTGCRTRSRRMRRSTSRWSRGSATRPRRAARLDAACLRGRLDEKLSHDNLYHSVLGLLDVTTPTYDRRLDIWSACKRRDEG